MKREEQIQLSGVDRLSSARKIEAALVNLGGVEFAQCDIVTGRLKVRYLTNLVNRQAIENTIASLGFKVRHVRAAGEPDPEARRALRREAAIVAATFGLAATAFCAGLIPALESASLALYIAAVLVGSHGIIGRAAVAIRRFDPDIYVLMIVAIIGAMLLGKWLEASIIVSLFSLALHLEHRSMERARREIGQLVELAPRMALVRRDEEEIEVPADQVRVGETVIVKPGEKIPLDGVIRSGASEINQAAITGEAMPAFRGPGDEVFAGTINGSGGIEIECTAEARQTVIARVIDLVEHALESKAPVQRFIERFARIYTPALVTLALAVFLVPPLLLGGDWKTCFYRSLVILVIACPCALVMSTPVAIVSGLAAAARAGVLIKGGTFLESLGRIAAMAFDKTGTLTYGEPKLMQVLPLHEMRPADVLQIAAAVESRSEHPLARAVLARAHQIYRKLPKVEDFRAIPGKGASARVDGKIYFVGSHQLFHDMGLCNESLHRNITRLEERGHGVLVVGSEQKPLGILVVADDLRENAHEAVEALFRVGIGKMALLTGDHEASAEAIGYIIGIQDVRCSMMPEDKLDAIREFQRYFGQVGMVGDGINDAPALAEANVGIAMGITGTDIALEVADVALLADDLMGIPKAVRIGRRTLAMIRQNIALALIAKVLIFIFFLAGEAELWMAVAADMAASLAVVGNSLRLLRFRKAAPQPDINAETSPA